MDPGHLKAELDRLAGAIERAGGRVTERDLNYVEDSAEPVLRAARRAPPESTPRRCRIRYLGSAAGQSRERADADPHAEPDHLRTLTAVTDASAQRAESAFGVPRTLVAIHTHRHVDKAPILSSWRTSRTRTA